MLPKSEKFYKILKIIGITALVCTAVLSVFILAEGLVPGDKSAEQSNTAAGIVDDIFDVDTDDNPDPSAVDDDNKTLTTAEFRMLVRKGLGHFGLFTILGFGLMFTYFLLLKPRWLSAVVSIAAGFTIAGVSELFQLPLFTTGRYASWTDIGIDTLGVVTGMAIAALIIFATWIIWKKADPRSFAVLKSAYNRLTFKSAFSRRQKSADDISEIPPNA